jgi:hypothetical protein
VAAQFAKRCAVVFLLTLLETVTQGGPVSVVGHAPKGLETVHCVGALLVMLSVRGLDVDLAVAR